MEAIIIVLPDPELPVAGRPPVGVAGVGAGVGVAAAATTTENDATLVPQVAVPVYVPGDEGAVKEVVAVPAASVSAVLVVPWNMNVTESR